MTGSKHSDEDRVEFYTDDAGEVRWRFRAAGNGEVMADSAEGYKSFLFAWDGAERVVGRKLIRDSEQQEKLLNLNNGIGFIRAIIIGEAELS
jgi:uncharacterized protein YegP (UPF0339 family)